MASKSPYSKVDLAPANGDDVSSRVVVPAGVEVLARVSNSRGTLGRHSRTDRENRPASDEEGTEIYDELPPNPKRWLILAVFSLVAQGNGMVFLALSSVSGKAQTFYGVSADKVNLATILFYAVYVPFMPCATWLVNTKDGLRKSVMVAAVSMAVGTIIRVAAYEGTPQSFTYLLIGTSIAAINGPFLMACFTLVPANWFPESERGIATSIGVLANQMGMVVGYLIPPLIISETEDNETLKKQMTVCHITIAGIAIIAAFLSYATFQSKPSTSGYGMNMDLYSRDEMPVRQAISLCISNPDFWVYGLAFSFMAPLYWDMGTLLYQNMHPSGYSDTEIQIPGVILQAIAIPGMISAGKLIDATHRFESIILGSLVLGCGSMAVFSWALTTPNSKTNLAIITLAAASLGFAFSMVQPALLDIVAERTHPVPHGYTCSVLYLGTMVIGAVYIFIGDAMDPITFNILLTALIAVALLATLVAPLVFPSHQSKVSMQERVIDVYPEGNDMNTEIGSDVKE
mmetsp:Transcript_21306/g.52144  ORF Transcript_21306/g.52144 Transcript_21306/m.52144 type:complete len:515 (-) Transcript_21306:186-1730(-)|eukprot:CAMPEP_0114497446 /NCGR_PEP_ID=MMETSP0109-20121206/6331_1 /TAXON_ID=29199 /ORGANISM="Chlorarachnion reptans, Strain CCCM449" /LENGTH=514 /DNA_ID=CAMNT_0001674833 /DNA_START=125 /DNA_END=1669 /DNA_ORIENTATION=+